MSFNFSFLKYFFMCMSVLLIASCGGGGSDDGGGSASADCGNFRIINGEECTRANIPTVLIEISSPEGFGTCTGTVIGDNAVLTAAHCTAGITSATIIHDNGVVNGEVAITHQLYDGTSDFDLGIITATNIRGILGVERAIIGTSTAVNIGDRLTIVGYGVDENGNSAQGLPNGNPRVTDIQVVDTTSTRIFNTFEATNTNACFGDSGAGAYKDNRIVGIESAGTTNDCKEGDINILTRTSTQGAFDFISRNVPDAQF